jgi:superfamily II DNA or RNA helicase
MDDLWNRLKKIARDKNVVIFTATQARREIQQIGREIRQPFPKSDVVIIDYSDVIAG